MKPIVIKIFPFIIVGAVLFMLGALHYGWLNPFFFETDHTVTFNSGQTAKVQGIDYFALPKSYLNLLEKRSIYDTWGGTPYGPYATWYLAHPAFSVFVASWFSWFSPWTGYWLFTLFSVALIAYSGYLISRETNDVLKKQLSYALLLCAFPTYSVLYVGNMHAPLMLALTLIFLGIFELAYAKTEEQTRSADRLLFAGLLASFFTKPIVLLMLPLLLLLRETRKTTIVALVIYGVVSFLFIVVPFLNPQAVGLSKLAGLNIDFIQQNMNIFKNGFVLNEYMKDNSIHWLNLIAQSDYKLMHINIHSLPVYIDTMLGRETPARIYKLPIYICLLLSFGICFIKDSKIRLEAALLLVMAISLTFFLSYNTVWEYQYASALPVVAMLLLLKERQVFYSRYIPIMFFLGVMFCLPSLYFLVRNGDFKSNFSLTLIRSDRVLPALFIFLIMIWQIIRVLVVQFQPHQVELKTDTITG